MHAKDLEFLARQGPRVAGLGDLLKNRGWISDHQLDDALARQQGMGGLIGTCLLELGTIKEDLLLRVLSEQLRVPAAAADDLMGIPPTVSKLLPRDLATRYLAVPFRAMGSRVDVALLDVRNLALHDELAFVIGKKLNIHIANEARIHEALEKHYAKDLPARFAHILERLNRDRQQRKKPTERAATPGSPTASPRPRPSTSPPAQPTRPSPAPSRIIAHELKIKSTEPRVVPPGATGSTGTRPPVERPQQGRSTARPASPVPPDMRQSQPSAQPTTRPTSQSQDSGGPRPRSRPIRRRPAAPRRTVPLSDQEKRSLQTSRQAPAATPEPVPDRKLPFEILPPATPPSKTLSPQTPSRSPPTRPRLSLGDVEQLLEKTRQPSEVGRVLLDYLSEEFPRVVLFKVFHRHVAGWMGRGQNLDLSRLQAYEIDFEQPSIFLNLRQTGSFFLGRLPDMQAHIELASCWSETSAHECAIFPIRVRDRAVSYIYLDRNHEGLDGLDFEALRRISTMAAIAFEMCIMKQKLRRVAR